MIDNLRSYENNNEYLKNLGTYEDFQEWSQQNNYLKIAYIVVIQKDDLIPKSRLGLRSLSPPDIQSTSSTMRNYGNTCWAASTFSALQGLTRLEYILEKFIKCEELKKNKKSINDNEEEVISIDDDEEEVISIDDDEEEEVIDEQQREKKRQRFDNYPKTGPKQHIRFDDDGNYPDNIISVEQIMRGRLSESDKRTLDDLESTKTLEDFFSPKDIYKDMEIDLTPDIFFIAEEKDSENLRSEIINLCNDERTKKLIREKRTKIFFEKRQNDIIGFLLFSKINDSIDDSLSSLIIHEVCIEEKNFGQFFTLFKKAFNNPLHIYSDTKNKKTKIMLKKHKFEENKNVYMQDVSLVLKI